MAYTLGVFTVEGDVRRKWSCDDCEILIQAPIPGQIIGKGIPAAWLLNRVMIAEYADHSPVYCQELIFGRVGLAIPPLTLANRVGITSCSYSY